MKFCTQKSKHLMRKHMLMMNEEAIIIKMEIDAIFNKLTHSQVCRYDQQQLNSSVCQRERDHYCYCCLSSACVNASVCNILKWILLDSLHMYIHRIYFNHLFIIDPRSIFVCCALCLQAIRNRKWNWRE